MLTECDIPFLGPLEPSPNSMKNLEEFGLEEAHSELVDAQTSKWQNQKSPVTGFETPIKSVIGKLNTLYFVINHMLIFLFHHH